MFEARSEIGFPRGCKPKSRGELSEKVLYFSKMGEWRREG
jgi:hypothetical protein